MYICVNCEKPCDIYYKAPGGIPYSDCCYSRAIPHMVYSDQKSNTKTLYNNFDTDLAVKLSRYVHDNCSDVPHDIGIHLMEIILDHENGGE